MYLALNPKQPSHLFMYNHDMHLFVFFLKRGHRAPRMFKALRDSSNKETPLRLSKTASQYFHMSTAPWKQRKEVAALLSIPSSKTCPACRLANLENPEPCCCSNSNSPMHGRGTEMTLLQRAICASSHVANPRFRALIDWGSWPLGCY